VALAFDQEQCLLRLNSSTEEELSALPGVGPKRAAALVRHRPFKSWDALKKVPCLGERTIKNLQNYGVKID
jgi:competence protein ComEA